MTIRKPAVAGSFYPATKEELLAVLREMELQMEFVIPEKMRQMKIIGGIVPHAGYMYSGSIALPFFKAIAKQADKFETVIILHPNHQGRGPAIALDVNDAWQTPLAITPIDLELSEALGFQKSNDAHRFEHSGEVMLPMLQYFFNNNLNILPIALSRQDYHEAASIALQLKKAVEITGRRVMILASSDFSHFVSPQAGAALDDKAIVHITNLNTRGFFEAVQNFNLSICGYGPIMVLMEFAKASAIKAATHMLARGHSGQITQHDDVVHYATILIYETAGQ